MKTQKIDTNLEKYLAQYQSGDEFIVRILCFDPINFYIRPYNKDGETINFTVVDGMTECVSERLCE